MFILAASYKTETKHLRLAMMFQDPILQAERAVNNSRKIQRLKRRLTSSQSQRVLPWQAESI